MNEKIETFDTVEGVGILSGKPPETRFVGPRRRAPHYYAGETYGRRRMHYPDVERNPDGSIPGIRNKFMRRLIRKAFKTHHSKVEKALKLPRAMLEQAREIAKENGHGSRWAHRMFTRELAIHQEVYVPLDLRAERTKKRRLKREGKQDAIAQLVDKMARR